MAKDIKLPDIGEGVTEGEVVKWLVQPGDKVSADQPVLEVMTDKATVEVPTPFAGTVKELKVKEGDNVPIEATLMTLEEGGATTAPSVAEKPKQDFEKRVQTQKVTATPAAASVAATSWKGNGSVEGRDIYPPAADLHVLATPSTRRLAREMNVDINQLQGTGLAGRVTREDVQKLGQEGSGAFSVGQATFARSNSFAPNSEERVALRGIRRKIAEQMQTTKASCSPLYYYGRSQSFCFGGFKN